MHLIELGNSPKTINDGKLAALKAIFYWGVENRLRACRSGAERRRARGGWASRRARPPSSSLLVNTFADQAVIRN